MAGKVQLGVRLEVLAGALCLRVYLFSRAGPSF